MRKYNNDLWMENFKNTWTWNRLTEEEQEQFYFAIKRYERFHKEITRETISHIFLGFLIALGYNEGDFSWRDTFCQESEKE